MAWAFFDHPPGRDGTAGQHALEMRADELTTRTLAPGSALACLDAIVGETVGAACEKAVFATPASAATAISYVAARLTLLADMVGYAKAGGAGIETVLVPMRRSLETDRFGLVAHVLAMRDGCTGESCKALALLHDPTHVRANLMSATLDRYVEHYAAAWAQSNEGQVAENNAAAPSALTQPTPQGPHKVTVNIDFPTAASIPPVSIMNPEPKGPPQSAAAAPAGSSNASAAGSSARRVRRQGANPPAVAQSQPSPAAAEGQVEPVWTPAPLAAPPALPAAAAPAPAPMPAANVASGANAPMPLGPFASPPANPGTMTRTQ
jgi:hypothetical protein